LPKRDWLRPHILVGMKCYLLGATPPPAAIYRDIVDDVRDAEVDIMHRVESRMILLRFGIDLKHTVLNFLKDLESHHGSKRSDRFRLWIETGKVSAYSHRQRQELYADQKRLKRRIHDGKDYRQKNPPGGR